MTQGPTIAILAPGAMGAGIGKRLTAHGARVLVPLEGRSAASRDRAADAGMIPATDEEVAAAQVILSVVSPAYAEDVAERVAAIGGKGHYADLNAITPDRAQRIAGIVQAAGFTPVDGGIVGGPPSEKASPTIYLSGEGSPGVAALAAYGLRFEVMTGDIGRASALKLSYAGITKGLTALGATMLLAAERAGVEEPLLSELATSQPEVAAILSRSLPGMLPKAERWVPEMEEISSYVGASRPDHRIHAAIAGLYDKISRDYAAGGPEPETLKRLAAILRGEG